LVLSRQIPHPDIKSGLADSLDDFAPI